MTLSMHNHNILLLDRLRCQASLRETVLFSRHRYSFLQISDMPKGLETDEITTADVITLMGTQAR